MMNRKTGKYRRVLDIVDIGWLSASLVMHIYRGSLVSPTPSRARNGILSTYIEGMKTGNQCNNVVLSMLAFVNRAHTGVSVSGSGVVSEEVSQENLSSCGKWREILFQYTH